MTAESLKRALRACRDVDGARHLLRGLGYPVLSSAVQEDLSELPEGAKQVVPEGYLLCKVEDDAFRVYYLRANHTTRTRLRAFFEPFYRRYPQGNYLFIVQPKQEEQLLFVSPRRQLAQADAAAVKLVLRTLAVHRDEPFRTDLEILQSIALPQPASAEEIWQKHEQAFSVERVTQRFFEEYRRLFENAESRITGITGDAKRLFTQKLFNRLMFIRFLERKGWLRFDGRRDYLRALWEAHQQSAGVSFYRERLKPLFFAGLNTPQQVNVIGINRGGWLKELIGEVPYLNGGLFAEGEDDRNDAIDVPDEVIEPVLHDLLYRFNFTITESSPLDVEVAVDPEMLGKVFEELVTGRHETGSYYTPRPVVAFMCREALKGYLQSAIGEDADATARFVDQRDASALKDPEKVLDALRGVRVCDPACGSGAYLLGMLHELLELRSALFEQKKLDPRTLYDRKLEIIQRNLYGVDIDPFAVEIARLRLWLSLVVDDERNPLDDPGADVSLPNLDFKIEVGDSLLAPDPQGGRQPDIFRQQQIEQYERLKADYMRAHSDEEKRMLRAEIDQLREEIRRWAHPDGVIEGFDWRVEFAEVFKNGGFDIVVANPPYVRQELIEPVAKKKLLEQYAHAAEGRSDLYVYFYARALELLKPNGMHVFVCSNSWLDVGFGGKLQKYLLKHAHIRAVYDSALERQFASADVNTIISVLQKDSQLQGWDTRATRFIRLMAPFEQAVADPHYQRVIARTAAELWQAGQNEQGEYEGDKWGGKYLRAPDIYFTILEKGKDKLARLGDIAEVRRGFTTGANEFFYLEPVGTTVVEVLRSTGFQPVTGHLLGQGAQATGRAQAPSTPSTGDHEQDAHATYLDPSRQINKRQGAHLPHWTQEGATYFVTFRLADSLPQKVVEAWKRERAELIRQIRERDGEVTPAEQARLRKLFSERVERYLDAGHGACWLQRDDVAQIVANALRYFDGKRYRLWAWCIMPNHVHVVVQPLAGYELPSILHSWKSYTANEINKLLKRTGTVWQTEYYDHLVRNDPDFQHCVEYTLHNPEQAGLKGWKWHGFFRSMDFQSIPGSHHGQDAYTGDTGFQPVDEDLHGQDAQATGGTGGTPVATVRVKNGAGWEGEIEASWLRPVIKSPRELKTLRVRPEDLRYLVFMPPEEVRSRLSLLVMSGQLQKRYPKAWEYIEWGEKQGYHKRSTCASRQRWWDLGEKNLVNCAWPMVHNDRLLATECDSYIVVDHNLFEITCSDADVVIGCLNASFQALVRELLGRSNLGEGALKTEGIDIAKLTVLHPASLSTSQRERLREAFEKLAEREVKSIFEELGLPKPNRDYSNIRVEDVSLEKVLPDRRALDAVVFEVLGLSEQEQLAVYRAVVELVKSRLVKAKSV